MNWKNPRKFTENAEVYREQLIFEIVKNFYFVTFLIEIQVELLYFLQLTGGEEKKGGAEFKLSDPYSHVILPGERF